MRFLKIILISFVSLASLDEKWNGLTTSDCKSCRQSNQKYCIPFEDYETEGWCCNLDKYSLENDNPIETVSGYFTCADNTGGFICSNQIKRNEAGDYINQDLFESLCKYDRSKCYTSYSPEYAEKQSNEGKLVSVEEHMPMEAGTTANF